MTTLELGLSVKVRMTHEEAIAIILGYAFGSAEINFKGFRFATPIYGYRSYDCALLDGTRLITVNDILASCGLNSELSVSEMLPLIGLLDSGFSFPDLTDIPDFWRLDRTGIAPRVRSAVPSRCVNELVLWDAYEMKGASFRVGGTKISKIYHHKYPSKFPLFDERNIGRVYGKQDGWVGIWDDLNKYEAEFECLEHLFSTFRVANFPMLPTNLTRLRIIDILVWSSGRHRSRLTQLGRELIDKCGFDYRECDGLADGDSL